MGTDLDHRDRAERCVEKARVELDDADKALWLTLAASWLRLAEQVGHGAAIDGDAADEAALAIQASD